MNPGAFSGNQDAGPGLQIGMSGGFSIASLGSLLAAWWEADYGIAQVGGLVSAWTDKQNGIIAIAQGGAPAYSAAGGPSNRPYITNTIGDQLIATAFPAQPQPFEYFIVAQPSTLTPAENAYLLDFGPGNIGLTSESVAGAMQVYAGTNLTGPTLANTNVFQVDSQVNGGSSSISVNGGTATVGAAGASGGTGGISIGNYYGGSFGWLGNYFAFVVLNGLASPYQRAGTIQYLRAKWGTG
jgi:hypothetical protein